jgi:hypothetical protein
VKLF